MSDNCKTALIPCCPNCGYSAGGIKPRKTKTPPFRCSFCGHEFEHPDKRQMIDQMCEECRTAELARFPQGARLGARLARRRAFERQVSREVFAELKREGWRSR